MKRTQYEFGLTKEALADVEAGRVVDHEVVQAWADSLETDHPLSIKEICKNADPGAATSI